MYLSYDMSNGLVGVVRLAEITDERKSLRLVSNLILMIFVLILRHHGVIMIIGASIIIIILIIIMIIVFIVVPLNPNRAHCHTVMAHSMGTLFLWSTALIALAGLTRKGRGNEGKGGRRTPTSLGHPEADARGHLVVRGCAG